MQTQGFCRKIFLCGDRKAAVGVASAFLHCRPFFSPCHSRLRAGILGGFMRGIALHYCLAGVHPRQRLPGSRIKCGMTAHCAAVPSRSLCTAAHTPTPSGNPGQPYVRYCVALLPRRCPSPPTPPRVPHQVRDDGVLRRCAIALPLHCRPHSHHVIPASERESWAALCAVLRCTIASPVSIPAAASQGPVSEHGMTVLLRRLCCFAAVAAIATACASLLVSLMRQLGGGSAIRASTIALTLHQLFGSAAGMTVQKGRAGGERGVAKNKMACFVRNSAAIVYLRILFVKLKKYRL